MLRNFGTYSPPRNQVEKPLSPSEAPQQSLRSTRPYSTGKLLCSAAMTESIDTAPLRGQSLRGRPVHEICTPVNQGTQLLLRRRGGGGLATALPSGQTGAPTF